MKLIRLSTEDKSGFFNNDFSSDIPIMKNSKVALHSLSFEPIINVLVVDATNDNITYNLTNTTPANSKTINLTHGTFTTHNFQDFLDDFTDKINNSLVFEAGKAMGTQFKAFINSQSKKAHLFFNYSNPQQNREFEIVNDLNVSQNFIRKNNNTNSTNDTKNISSNRPFTQGCGCFRVRLRDLKNNGGADNTNGFTMGLTTTPPDQFGANVTKDYVIRAFYSTKNYSIQTPATAGLVDSGILPHITDAIAAGNVNCDNLEIVVTQGRIQGRIYRQNQANFDLLFDEVLDRTRTYYPIVSFQGGQNTTQINQIRYSYDTFKYEDNNINTVSETETNETFSGFTVAPPNFTGGRTIYNLILPETIAGFLGFKLLNTIKGGVIGNFIADTQFEATLKNDAYIIEMKNMELESYDGFTKNGERKNILAVIPKNNNDGLVEYEPNTPYFIDMKNVKENIRNVSARILRADLEPVIMGGLASMTILIKCPDE